MAWIDSIEEDQGGASLREAYSTVRGARGEVANILKIHSLRPDVLVAHLHLYRDLMFGRSELTRRERETIAVSVSVLNRCHYWIQHHGEALRRTGESEQVIEGLRANPLTAPLDSKRIALVRYAAKLTRDPSEVRQEDIHDLRTAGFSDQAIHDAAAVIAYFNFVNRMALGLGVELEWSG